MCCLFGLLDPQHRLTGARKTKLLHTLATAAEARGTDASGIAYCSGERLTIHKEPVPGRFLQFQIPDETTAIMGHTRMTTQGNEKYNPNNHPFRGNAGDMPFALAHNGVIWNDKELCASCNLPPTPIETDSYIAVQLIEQQKALDLASLKFMAEQVEGSFTFTVLNAENSLYIVKGDSPLYMLRLPKTNVYVYASTAEILYAAAKSARLSLRSAEKIEINSGEIVSIDRRGQIARGTFDDSKLYQSVWSDPRQCVRCDGSSYLSELKDVAAWMGYPPELIDHFTARGYVPEEIEELLYEGEI